MPRSSMDHVIKACVDTAGIQTYRERNVKYFHQFIKNIDTVFLYIVEHFGRHHPPCLAVISTPITPAH